MNSRKRRSDQPQTIETGSEETAHFMEIGGGRNGGCTYQIFLTNRGTHAAGLNLPFCGRRDADEIRRARLFWLLLVPSEGCRSKVRQAVSEGVRYTELYNNNMDRFFGASNPPPVLRSVYFRLDSRYTTRIFCRSVYTVCLGSTNNFFFKFLKIKIKIGDYVELANDQALVKYHYFWSCQS